MRRTSFKSCMCHIVPKYELMPSADLELTVSLLVQIDKLVMLIESPVFLSPSVCYTIKRKLMSRSEATIAGTGQIPIST